MKKSKELIKAREQLEKEMQSLYGDDVVHVAAGFGFHDKVEGKPHEFMIVFSDDKTVRDSAPKEYLGFPVRSSDIPKAY